LTLLLFCVPPATAVPRAPSAAAARQQIPAPPLAPDFSAITTRAAAGKLVRKRLLVKIHFFPTELGGEDVRFNIGYVTPEAAASQARLVEMLSRYMERDLVDRLEIEPEYKGNSVVPSRIRMKARHSRGGKSFESVIEVWGCGVCAPFEPLPDPGAPGDVTA